MSMPSRRGGSKKPVAGLSVASRRSWSLNSDMPDAAAELRTDHLLSSLGRRSVRGGVVSFAAQGFKLALQIATVIVLARLLLPAAFGLIAMVAAFSTVLDLMKELGLSAATIQKQDITHAEVTALFWINAGAGASIAVLLFLAAPLIAHFYDQPSLIVVTRWLSVGFLLSGLTVQHWALLRRQMRFSTAAAIDTSGDIAGFIVAIALAHFGAGYWALVAQRLTGPVLVLIGSWSLCAWRPGAPRRAPGVGKLLRFGISVTGVNMAAAFSRSIDQILIGWLWGANTLGLYERASKLLLTPLNNIGAPLYAVAMPGLSRIEDQSERYRRVFCEVLEKLAMVVVPGGLFISITADWVVHILFGPQWLGATPLVACFAVAVAYQPLMQTTALLYLTQDRPHEMVRAALIDTTLAVFAILAGLPFGATAVAASLTVIGVLLRSPVAFWLSSRRGPVIFSDMARAVFPAVIAGIVVFASVGAARLSLLPTAAPASERLVLAALIAVPAAFATFCVIPRSRLALRSFLAMAKHLRGPPPPLKD